jgi:hypothetical protein
MLRVSADRPLVLMIGSTTAQEERRKFAATLASSGGQAVAETH